MPQTIALQRGTTTVTTNGTNAVTLFTQSGGLATRVIVNQLAMTISNPADESGVNVALYHESSGGQTSILGWFRRADTSSMRALQFFVGASTDNNWRGNAPTSDITIQSSPVIAHAQTGDMFATSPQNVGLNYSTSSQQRFSILPSNFYIGPNDALRIKAQASNSSFGTSNTLTISYSFTTITET